MGIARDFCGLDISQFVTSATAIRQTPFVDGIRLIFNDFVLEVCLRQLHGPGEVFALCKHFYLKSVLLASVEECLGKPLVISDLVDSNSELLEEAEEPVRNINEIHLIAFMDGHESGPCPLRILCSLVLIV